MIHFDMSSLTRLTALLDAASATVAAAATGTVSTRAEMVAAQARAIAAGYPKGTGALAGDVNVTVNGNEADVYTNQREGYFLEAGSPNTGAPRQWLTGPAEMSIPELGEALTALGAIF